MAEDGGEGCAAFRAVWSAVRVSPGLSPKFLPFVSRAFGRFDAHDWA